MDLVIQFDPPRDVDTYVHRSGRTGRAGQKGVSVLLFNPGQARDIVRIERDLGHGFEFNLVGPPSTEAALKAAAKTSAVASCSVSEETAKYFRESAKKLLANGDDPTDVIARCLAAISRRSSDVESRSLITGEVGLATVEMSNSNGRPIGPNDVMFTVGKLSRMSKSNEDLAFDNDIGKIDANPDSGVAVFDLPVEDAKRLVDFSKDIDAGGNAFRIIHELEIERDRHFGRSFDRRGGRDRDGGRFGRGGGNFDRRGRGDLNRRGGSGGGNRFDRGGSGGYQGRSNNFRSPSRDSSPYDSGYGRSFRGRFDSRRSGPSEDRRGAPSEGRRPKRNQQSFEGW